MEQNPVPPHHQSTQQQMQVQRRRAAFVLVVGAIILSGAILVLRSTGHRASSRVMLVVATFLAAEGIQLIAEWWKPHWFQPGR